MNDAAQRPRGPTDSDPPSTDSGYSSLTDTRVLNIAELLQPDGRTALRKRDGVLIAALAAVMYSWALGGSWRQDDAMVLRRGDEQLRFIPAASGALLRGEGLPAPEIETWLFLPVCGLLWRGAAALSGSVDDLRIFHGLNVLLHAATALAALRFFGRWMGRGGAIAGALVVATAPGAIQAVSWVAALPDIVVTLLMLLACDLAWTAARAAGWRRVMATLMVGLTMAAAFATKATAYGIAPIPLVILLWRPEGGTVGRRLVDLVPTLLLVAVVVILRTLYLGTPWPLYAAGGHLNIASLPRLSQNLGPFLVQLFVPWCLDPVMTGVGPLLRTMFEVRGVLALCVAALPIAAVVLAPRRTWRPMVAAAACFFILLLPALWVYFGPDSWTTSSRACYVLYAALGVAFGTAFEALWSPGQSAGLRRTVLLILGLIALAVTADAFIHVARTEIRASEVIAARLDEIRRDARKTGSSAALFVIDPTASFAGVGMPFFPDMFKPPFAEPARTVRWFRTREELLETGALAAEKLPVRVIAFDSEHATSVASAIGALPSALPVLLSRPPRDGAAALWVPVTDVPPRAVRALRFEFAPNSGVSEASLRTERGVVAVSLDGASGLDVVVLDRNLEWLTAATLKSISVTGALPVKPPVLLPEVPSIGIVEPAEEASVPAGVLPTLVLKGLPPRSSLRVRYAFTLLGTETPMTYVLPEGRVVSGADERAVFTPTTTDRVLAESPELRWENVSRLFARHFATLGISTLDIRVTVEARTPDGLRVRARSDVLTLRLQADPQR